MGKFEILVLRALVVILRYVCYSLGSRKIDAIYNLQRAERITNQIIQELEAQRS